MGERKNQIPSRLRHGVYSGLAVLPGEDHAAFEKFHREIIEEYNLSGRSEEELGDYLARLMWRRQNLSTYRIAEHARKRHGAIYAECRPPSGIPDFDFFKQPETRSEEELCALREEADKQAQNELGAALELVEAGNVATTDYLLEELSITERLGHMIERCLKQLLFIRGLKSILSPSATTVTTPRIPRLVQVISPDCNN
jgi:hypothetical protein